MRNNITERPLLTVWIAFQFRLISLLFECYLSISFIIMVIPMIIWTKVRERNVDRFLLDTQANHKRKQTKNEKV